MISWNAVLGYDTFEWLAEMPQKAETVSDVRGRHITRMLADGITHSVLDPFLAQVPYDRGDTSADLLVRSLRRPKRRLSREGLAS